MLDPLASEVVVLGACLLSEKAADRAVARLTVNDFYRNAHGVVFGAVVKLRNAGRPADTVTVMELLARQDRLDEIGGPVALPDLASSCPSPANVDHYIDLVLDHARRRQVAELAAKLGQGVADGSKPLHTVLADARDQLEGVRPAGRRLKVYTDDEMDNLPPVSWLVDGLMVDRGLTVVYGAPKHGKSFVALDWALSMLAGRDWHGRPVAQVPSVVYLAPEGASGYRSRRKAWRTHTGLHPTGLHLVTTPISLLDPADVGEVDAIVGDTGGRALIVDTWARCMGGDENDTRDTGEAVRALDRIRDRHDCAILVLHHSGNAHPDRMRGNSALYGALDSQIRVAKQGEAITVMQDAVKDAPAAPAVQFRLQKAGPSAVLVTSGRRNQRTDEDICQQLRTRLRSTPAKVIDLDAIADGRNDLVWKVLDEPEFETVDPLEQPPRYTAIRSLV